MNEALRQKFEEAMGALSRTDFPAAIELLGEVVVEDSENAEAWCQLGVCYLETQRPDLALEALSRAAKADPKHALAQYLLGNAHGTLGHLEDAAASYRRALQIDPRLGKAEEFLIKTESLLESREHYRSGIKLLYTAEITIPTLNQALREFVQSVAIFGDSPARENLLNCSQKLFDRKSTLDVPMPAAPGLHNWARACERGFHCIQFNNWVGAREAYQEALSYRAQDAFVHHALGFCFVELSEIDDAVRAWLRVLELSPNYDFSRFGRVRQEKD